MKFKKGSSIMSFITSNVNSPGYPPNCVGAAPMTKIVAEDAFDTQRPEIARAMEERENPSTPSYKWPLIGLAVAAVATFVVSRTHFKPPKVKP